MARGLTSHWSWKREEQSFSYHADGLGSITELTDSTGAVAQSYVYDSFEQIVQQIGMLTNPYTYTGRELDPESGLYYYRARYYDARIGRFLQEDPVGFAGGKNFYIYLNDNPINFADPSGLIIDELFDIGFIASDLYRLAIGGPCEREENISALTADIIGLAIPGATGFGLGVRAAQQVTKASRLVTIRGKKMTKEFVKRAAERGGVPAADMLETLDKAVPIEKINQVTGERSLLRRFGETIIATNPEDNVLKTVIRKGPPKF